MKIEKIIIGSDGAINNLTLDPFERCQKKIAVDAMKTYNEFLSECPEDSEKIGFFDMNTSIFTHIFVNIMNMTINEDLSSDDKKVLIMEHLVAIMKHSVDALNDIIENKFERPVSH